MGSVSANQVQPWWRLRYVCRSRRKLVVAAVALCALTAGFAAAQARQPLPKIGVLWVADASWSAKYLPPFKDGLRELGWIHGQTVQIIERYDTGDSNRLPGLAKELVALGVDVLFITDGAVPAARQATSTIPIVCSDFVDPVSEGVTTSLARPDRNFTGVSWQSRESGTKRVQLTKELMPRLQRVGFLFDATDPAAVVEARAMGNAVRAAGLDFRGIDVKEPGDFPAAFVQLKRERPDALLVSAGATIFEARDKIIAFASAARLPVINEIPEFAEAGAVLTYGAAIPETYRRGAYFVDRILRGAKVADLPIEQPTKFDLVVNMKAATALRLKVPESIATNATRVIR